MQSQAFYFLFNSFLLQIKRILWILYMKQDFKYNYQLIESRWNALWDIFFVFKTLFHYIKNFSCMQKT